MLSLMNYFASTCSSKVALPFVTNRDKQDGTDADPAKAIKVALSNNPGISSIFSTRGMASVEMARTLEADFGKEITKNRSS